MISAGLLLLHSISAVDPSSYAGSLQVIPPASPHRVSAGHPSSDSYPSCSSYTVLHRSPLLLLLHEIPAGHPSTPLTRSLWIIPPAPPTQGLLQLQLIHCSPFFWSPAQRLPSLRGGYSVRRSTGSMGTAYKDPRGPCAFPSIPTDHHTHTNLMQWPG